MHHTIGPDTLLLLTNDGLGHAPEELRQKVVVTYLRLLLENATLPGAIAFYTRGVHLVAEGSPALEVLAELEAKGVRLIVCKTCVEWFGLADRLRVGIVGGMGDIVSAQAMAAKVITL
jgi:intracellular sulfur oxidation DsrE/DsrF family protein